MKSSGFWGAALRPQRSTSIPLSRPHNIDGLIFIAMANMRHWIDCVNMSAFHSSFTMASQEKVPKFLPKLIDELVIWPVHDL
jgi:hypothetical protein